MKHLLPLLLSLLTALPALATDDELLDRIEQTRPSAFTTAVEHTKPGKKSFAAERGMIYYTAPGSFAMRSNSSGSREPRRQNPVSTFRWTLAFAPFASAASERAFAWS